MADSTPKSAAELEKSVRSSASWCFWVAALTAVNAAMALSGSDRGFVLGTAMAQAAMQIARDAGNVGKGIAVVVNVVAIGYFVGMGLLAQRGRRWAFVLAFLAYGADTLLLLLDPDFLPIAFHVWVLFSLGVGFMAVKPWREAQAREQAEAVTPPVMTSAVETGGGAPPVG